MYQMSRQSPRPNSRGRRLADRNRPSSPLGTGGGRSGDSCRAAHCGRRRRRWSAQRRERGRARHGARSRGERGSGRGRWRAAAGASRAPGGGDELGKGGARGRDKAGRGLAGPFQPFRLVGFAEGPDSRPSTKNFFIF